MTGADELTWRVLGSRITYSDQWLTVRSDDCVTPSGVVVAPYHVLDFPNWINVVAFTPELKLLLVREYRHGAGRAVTGLVSGVVEPGEAEASDEGLEHAARRELAEETGYGGGEFELLVQAWSNPANQTNRVSSYLAIGVHPVGEPQPDDAEQPELLLADPVDFLRSLRDHRTDLQAMHVAALWSAVVWICSPTGRSSSLAPLGECLREEFFAQPAD
jgi:ADP-ribose pyrophosphatase